MKKKTAKEMAELRKLQKQRAIDNKKREESLLYRIGSTIIDSTFYLFLWIGQMILLLFSGLSVAMTIIVLLIFIFLIAFFVYSIYNGDTTGIIFSLIAIPIIGSGLWIIKKK